MWLFEWPGHFLASVACLGHQVDALDAAVLMFLDCATRALHVAWMPLCHECNLSAGI